LINNGASELALMCVLIQANTEGNRRHCEVLHARHRFMGGYLFDETKWDMGHRLQLGGVLLLHIKPFVMLKWMSAESIKTISGKGNDRTFYLFDEAPTR
jgi:hypothetical protein